jgi:uncharacterized membrane protein YkoI
MSDEIENIKKRLVVVEGAIKDLRETDLFIAKRLFRFVAAMTLNLVSRTMIGEDARRFHELFSKKLEALDENLREAKNPEEAFEPLARFDSEVTDYVRAAKVDTADKAMEIAHSFIKKYSPVALPLKAERKDDVWMVDIDVGALAVKVAKVKVDARTGDILSYEIPEKK